MIDSIQLQNFRSYKDESFEFDPGVNIVIGPNASGKTNLLEAILILDSGKSFRAKDQDLIHFGKSWARLDGFFGSSHRVLKLNKDRHPGLDPGSRPDSGLPAGRQGFRGNDEMRLTKTFEIDNNSFKRLSLERTVPAVLFEPNHLQLITREPDFRRAYFDDILERSLPAYKNLAASYRRALAQRNALLKQTPAVAKKQLFAWNIRLSELGSQIASARHELVNDINKSLSRSYSKIAKKRTKVELNYETPFDTGNYSSRLLAKLEAGMQADFQRGFTAYGPHREDFALYLKGQPAQATASRGEIRSLLIALKIFELSLVEKARAAKPIFLLDDVFSELDGARRHHLVDYLKTYQTIITTTDADAVLEYFSSGHRLISL